MSNDKPAKPPKVDWTTLLKPEELAKARERLIAIKHEFNVVYGLKWTEYDTFSGRRTSKVAFEGFHAEAQDHGPLSYWTLHEDTPGGARKSIGGGDSIAYPIAIIEAMEALVEALDARAELAAEALRDPPDPLTGVTGPSGATSWPGPIAPPPLTSMTTGIAGPVAIWGASAWPGPTGPVGGSSAPAASASDDEDEDDED